MIPKDCYIAPIKALYLYDKIRTDKLTKLLYDLKNLNTNEENKANA